MPHVMAKDASNTLQWVYLTTCLLAQVPKNNDFPFEPNHNVGGQNQGLDGICSTPSVILNCSYSRISSKMAKDTSHVLLWVRL